MTRDLQLGALARGGVERPRMVLGPATHPIALGFKIDAVEGIPESECPSADLVCACGIEKELVPSNVKQAEWESLSGALGAELRRASYHRSRFGQVVEKLKSRRELVGGPSLADLYVAPAAYYEAVSVLGAARTAVDLIVYISARRAGKSRSSASAWSAADAIEPKVKPGHQPPTKYDTPEVLVLRRHLHWFHDLNLYRNVTHHRGWREQSFGYYGKADTAPEAKDPRFNVMLVPDAAPLRDGKRSDEWTYASGRWLDSFVSETERQLQEIAKEIATVVWGVTRAAPPKIPRQDQPNVMLHLPRVPALPKTVPSTLLAFESKPAARAFKEHLRKSNIRVVGAALRSVHPTRMNGEIPAFILSYDESALTNPAVLKLIGRDGFGRPRILQDLQFDPVAQNGPVRATLSLQVQGVSLLYVLHATGRLGDEF